MRISRLSTVLLQQNRLNLQTRQPDKQKRTVTTPIRVAVIGLGRMGRRHVQVARDLRLELVGVCDQNPKALERIGEEERIPEKRRFSNASTLLKEARKFPGATSERSITTSRRRG